ncbi:hypothetical protein V6N11_053682 [Hibiscus sabdariffa]|uniref:Uncharacterized protein n=2 Tax=Hibiscus sabdariffa TaxID=183260 RepID=A0ABR2BV29_9ROSI
MRLFPSNSSSTKGQSNGGSNRAFLYLNVYDLTPMNNYLYWFGIGIFHSGIEVHGLEYGFGAHEYPTSGVFEVEPKSCPGFIFRRSILLGSTNLSRSEFRSLMEQLSQKYHGDTYHLIAKNCNHFTNEVCLQLTGKHIPGWVNRLAQLGSLCNCLLPESIQVTAVRHLPDNTACSDDEMSNSGATSLTAESEEEDADHHLLTTQNIDIAFLKEKPKQIEMEVIRHFLLSHPLVLTEPTTAFTVRDVAKPYQTTLSGLRAPTTLIGLRIPRAHADLSSTGESKDADKIQHSAHKHPLVLCQGKEFTGEVRCRACGTGSCDFFLHKMCAVKLPLEVHHAFHPQRPLILFSDSDFPFWCKGCDDSHEGSDLAYCCVECGFQLDVKCAFFPTVEFIDADKIMHCAHKHPLALSESNEFGNEVRCRACGESCLAPSFGCTECNFFLQKHCAIELHSEER